MYGFYDIAQRYDIIEQSSEINKIVLQLLPLDRFNWDF